MTDGLITIISTIAGWIVLAVFLMIIGWLTGRILGVRRGFFRALVAGLIGYGAGFIFVAFQGDSAAKFDQPLTALKLGAGFIGYVLLVTMLASIVLDVMFRPRKARRRSIHIPRPIRAIRLRLAILARIRDIVRAARHNGLIGRRFATPKALSTPEGARALRHTLEDSGGILVKFGQIASTREDLLPATITNELAELRSAAPPIDPDVVRQIVESELGAPIGEVFEEFDFTGFAAASIGATHRAVLKNGLPVIVKVQRPGIDEIVERDGRVLLWAAKQLDRRSDSARRLGILPLAEELVDGIKEEIDYSREAANNAAMRRTRTDDKGVAFPEIFENMTTRHLLIMQKVPGVSVDHRDAISRTGVPASQIADNVLRSFLGQVLQDGIYHADPHPGNLLIDESGTVWFIDYGAVGYLDPVTLEGLQQLGLGFVLRDPSMLARALRRLAGRDGEQLDIPSLEFDLGVILTDVQGGGFDPTALQEVVRVLGRHGVAVPRSLTVLARAMLTLDGTLRIIDPEYRMGPRAQEEMEGLIFAGESSPKDQLIKEGLRVLPIVRTLPQIAEDLGLQARSGRFTMRIDRFDGPDGERVNEWLDSIIFAVLGLGGLFGSAALLIASGMAGNSDISMYLRVIGFTGLVVSTAMQMRTVARIVNRGRPGDRSRRP